MAKPNARTPRGMPDRRGRGCAIPAGRWHCRKEGPFFVSFFGQAKKEKDAAKRVQILDNQAQKTLKQHINPLLLSFFP
jgi:hypothetical protein